MISGITPCSSASSLEAFAPRSSACGPCRSPPRAYKGLPSWSTPTHAVSDGYFAPVPSLVGSPSSSPEPDEAVDFAFDDCALHLSIRRASHDDGAFDTRPFDVDVDKTRPLPSPPLCPLSIPASTVRGVKSAIPRHPSPLSSPYNNVREFTSFEDVPAAPRLRNVPIFCPDTTASSRPPFHRAVTRLREDPYWDGCGCGCGVDSADDDVDGPAVFGLGVMVPASHQQHPRPPRPAEDNEVGSVRKAARITLRGRKAPESKQVGLKPAPAPSKAVAKTSAPMRRSKRSTGTTGC